MIALKLLVILPFIGCATPASAANPLDIAFVRFVNPILDNIISPLLDQKKSNENGTRIEFRDYLLNDESNADLGHATPQQIIERSGYRQETFNVISEDGYITQNIRIINPLADAGKLKRPPVMLVHGGLIDPTCWIWASAIQHHPEKYPRTIRDGPMTSWNRSLAFMLANNGYDVWLITSRGTNEQNQGHLRYKTKVQLGDHPLKVEQDRLKYWRFNMNQIVDHELPRQIDKVLKVTGSENLTVVALSIGFQTTASLFASNKVYAEKIHAYVAMGAPLTVKGTNNFFKASCNYFFLPPTTPPDLGSLICTDLATSQLLRDINLLISRQKRLRYSFIWMLFNIMLGPSATYQTNFEDAVVGHLAQPTSFELSKHFCQQLYASRLQRFDYGKLKNLKIYGSIEPPVYNISEIPIKNWAIVSGNNDNFGTTYAVKQLLRDVRPRAKHIFAPNYNHFDLVAGMDNDIFINLPILKYLNKFHR